MNDLQYFQECGWAYHWVSMSNISNIAKLSSQQDMVPI
jgi:hypothetical protein